MNRRDLNEPKSIRVRVGQKVRRGQVLALLGNSGDSYSPHLHFHVADGNSLFAAEGVPYVFESFEVQGVVPIQGVVPTLDEAWKRRQMQRLTSGERRYRFKMRSFVFLD